MKLILSLIGLSLSCAFAQSDISTDTMVKLLSAENEFGTEQYKFS